MMQQKIWLMKQEDIANFRSGLCTPFDRPKICFFRPSQARHREHPVFCGTVTSWTPVSLKINTRHTLQTIPFKPPTHTVDGIL